jgi:hypothetical protein
MGRMPDPDTAGPLRNKVHKRDIKKMFREARVRKTGVYRMVWMPDTHFPDHDEKAVGALIKFLKDYRPHGLGHIGDFMECGTVSHWDPQKNNILEFITELGGARELMGKIKKAARPTHEFFCVGNHEYWLDQFLEMKIPGIQQAIKDETGYNFSSDGVGGSLMKDSIPHNEILQIGHACFTHGFYTGTHHAKKMLEVLGTNIFYGHTEDQQKHSSVTIRGMLQAQSIGTLRSEEKVTFLRKKPTNWISGFLILEFTYDGSFTAYTPAIVDGKFIYNGKIYRG